MVKYSIGVLIIGTMVLGCSNQTNKKAPGDMELKWTNENIETKTNTCSSAGKAFEAGDSPVIIRPIHKYKHHKKYKIK